MSPTGLVLALLLSCMPVLAYCSSVVGPEITFEIPQFSKIMENQFISEMSSVEEVLNIAGGASAEEDEVKEPRKCECCP